MKKISTFLTLAIAVMGSAQLQDSKAADECFKKADYKCAEAGYASLADKERIGKLKAQYYNNLGTSQRRLGNRQQAFASYQNALKADPNILETYINLSSMHAQWGNKQSALDFAAKGLLLDSENAELFLTRAKVYEDLKKNDLAEKDYQHLISIAPDNLIARTNYATFKMNSGKLDAALKDYNTLISEKPESLLYNNRAAVYLAMKKHKEATADVDRAIKLDPKFSLSYVTKARIQFETNRATDACINLEKALKTGFEKYLINDLLKKCEVK